MHCLQALHVFISRAKSILIFSDATCHTPLVLNVLKRCTCSIVHLRGKTTPQRVFYLTKSIIQASNHSHPFTVYSLSQCLGLVFYLFISRTEIKSWHKVSWVELSCMVNVQSDHNNKTVNTEDLLKLSYSLSYPIIKSPLWNDLLNN